MSTCMAIVLFLASCTAVEDHVTLQEAIAAERAQIAADYGVSVDQVDHVSTVSGFERCDVKWNIEWGGGVHTTFWSYFVVIGEDWICIGRG